MEDRNVSFLRDSIHIGTPVILHTNSRYQLNKAWQVFYMGLFFQLFQVHFSSYNVLRALAKY